jgi:membrane-associated HD superfamily phosphohydrolase
MLADSVEAAVKSTGLTSIDEVETLIRRIIKGKNEQDQLVQSGLSYKDVETMLKAFLQVYAGHFHERVKYPEERTVRQPSKQI